MYVEPEENTEITEADPAPTGNAKTMAGAQGESPRPQPRGIAMTPTPLARRLRGYAFDPSLSTTLDTAMINEITFKVKWEKDLHIGPVGEYINVVDYDPPSDCFYMPVDLTSPDIIAQDGLTPSEGNPQFHQQMVYAVSMTTIGNFERALGRSALWAPHKPRTKKRDTEPIYVGRLRIYPHAMREANAYYSPEKKALLFGYFPASSTNPGDHFPGAVVFTCLSHDIIAHETTHALLDGMHEYFTEDTNPDVLAFHEAFADIVALFQRFSFPEVLRHQISKTRGNLATQNLLGELAQQFGKATGQYGALRSAIGTIDEKTKQWKALYPDPSSYMTVFEPHDRGAILVAAVFDAFLAIYNNRVADLMRIASNGTGVLPDGALHPDLVNRLTGEAAKSAEHVLGMCVRALDYCPPVDITFGDYLRAIITADMDLAPDDRRNYRVAFIEAFRRRGIYAQDVRTFSEDSLRWPVVRREDYPRAEFGSIFADIIKQLRKKAERLRYVPDRKRALREMSKLKKELHDYFKTRFATVPTEQQLKLMGIVLSWDDSQFSKDHAQQIDLDGGYPEFSIYSVRLAQRVGPDGYKVNQAVISITQTRRIKGSHSQIDFIGGCSLTWNLDTFELQYQIVKPVIDPQREKRQIEYKEAFAGSLRATYFGEVSSREPFAVLHRDYDKGGLL